MHLVPIMGQWSEEKTPDAWLFAAPEGGPLRESKWKRSVDWAAATAAIGRRGFRVHDLRHMAASVWRVLELTRRARALAAHVLAAPIARAIALTALTALGLSGDPVHEPVHARTSASGDTCYGA